MITYLDLKIGDLMQRIKLMGVDSSTVVFFASDNGGHKESGHHPDFFDSNGGLRGFKRSLFEGGVRSPTMARWPGVIPLGTTSDFQWAFWDVLPTLADLAGARAPPDLDGLSLAPTLFGGPREAHAYLYWTWVGTGIPPTPWAFTEVPGYAVRRGRWKGIVPHCSQNDTLEPHVSDSMMLFDLDSDPSETTDVSSVHADVVASLKQLVISESLSCQCYQGPCRGTKRPRRRPELSAFTPGRLHE